MKMIAFSQDDKTIITIFSFIPGINILVIVFRDFLTHHIIFTNSLFIKTAVNHNE